jgi:hypothetical protein
VGANILRKMRNTIIKAIKKCEGDIRKGGDEVIRNKYFCSN